MTTGLDTVSGRVAAGILEKADRLFRNDDLGVWTELLQNARRAGATAVEVTIEEINRNLGPCRITVCDNGRGIADFQALLTLGASGWSEETKAQEDPAGMGFFALCRSEVEVHSGNRCVCLTPEVFAGRGVALIEESAEVIVGARLRFTRESSKGVLSAALASVSEFCPLEVRLDGEALPRHDFLEGALCREMIAGIEVGFSTRFEWGWSPYQDKNWNFYGARIADPFEKFAGLLNPLGDHQPLTLQARFNVLDTGQVKLQLPDRRAIIQDSFLFEFHHKARAAIYRFFQQQKGHVLPHWNWKEAAVLGIDLPEAAPLLRTWHAEPGDDSIDPVFAHPEPRLLSDLSEVILVERDLPNAHTLEAALHSGAALEGALFQEETQYDGYSWYDSLPRIIGAELLIDGVPYEERQASAKDRPRSMELEVTIKHGEKIREQRLPVLVHVDANEHNSAVFVAVSESPWDNDALDGPFPLEDFLIAATFCSSDDSEADSWSTQYDAYREAVERDVSSYFRGPKATLVAAVRKTLDLLARDLAGGVGVKEIRCERTQDERDTWEIELLS